MTTFDETPVTPSAADTFAAQARAAGVPEDQIARTLGAHGIGGRQSGQPPGSPASRGLGADLPPPVREDLASSLSPSKTPRLSPSELEQGADTLSKHWTGDPQILRETFERLGLTEVDEADDARTELERDFDHTLGAPASLDDYRLPDLWVGRADIPVEDRADLTGAIRSTLAELNVPQVLGSAAASYMLDAVENWNEVRNDPVAAQRYCMDQQSLVCKVLGASWQDVIATIKPLVSRLSASNREIFVPNGVFEHGPLLVWLFRSAELLTIRKGLERTR